MEISHVYLITGFNVSLFRVFRPDPAVFLTEGEARAYCNENQDSGVLYTFEKVRVGRMGRLAVVAAGCVI